MAVPSFEPTVVSPQWNSNVKTPAQNLVVQLAQQQAIAYGYTTRLTATITGVTVSYVGLDPSVRLQPGEYLLSFIQSTKLISIGGGAGTDITADGTYTLTSPNGKQIKVICVSGSYPVANASDELVVTPGINKSNQQIIWNQLVTGAQFIQGTQFILPKFELNITGISNVTGVALNFNGLTSQQKLEIGTHSLVYTTAGTLLSIGGGAGVNVGAGGTFTLTSPDGTIVKAVVTAANLPGTNQTDTVTVGQYPLGNLIVKDLTQKSALDSIYAAY